MVDISSVLNKLKIERGDEVDTLVNEFSEITFEILSNYGYLQEAETEEEILELTEFSTLVALNVIADILEETDYIPDFVLADIFEQTAAIMPAENVKVRLRDRLKYYIQGLKQRLKEKLSSKKGRIANLLRAKKASIKRLIALKLGDKLGAIGDKIAAVGSRLQSYRVAKHALEMIQKAKEGHGRYSRLAGIVDRTFDEGPRKQKRLAEFGKKIGGYKGLFKQSKNLLRDLGF